MRVGERKRKRNSVIAGLTIGGAIIVAFIIFIVYMNKNVNYRHEVILGENSFEVTGLHGGVYEYSAAKSVELLDTIPEVVERTNGAAIGEVKKGTFKLADYGLTRLYLLSNEGPYLQVRINDFYVLINYEEATETKALYEELKTKLGL